MKKKFKVLVEMEERWIPDFLGMLKTMEYLGNVGSSREVSFYSDGDGDYRPKFTFSSELSVKGKKEKDGKFFFDAG